MSLEMYVFIRRSDVPDRKQWQETIDTLEIPLALDPTLKPFTDSGYSPCTLMGKASGFEINFDSAAEYLADIPDLNAGDRDVVITFRWGGDLFECACAMTAALALASSHGALSYYPDDELLYAAEDMKSELFALLEDLN